MSWKLLADSGEFSGQEIIVERDLLVGRHQDADILLQSADVSRRHAVLLFKDDQVWVQDLNSSNGTFLNDERIEQEAELQHGDRLQFASFVFAVHAPVQVQERLPENKPVESNLDDQGMPSIAERSADTSISRDGMPQNITIPKPAPIPENSTIQSTIDKSSVQLEPLQESVELQRKNASVGLISMIVLVILAILAWLFFK
jgi:pSer/pThr/pTyr-binding forkhead associated (FHA) protein